jgi:hypothetical protein
MPSVVQAQSNRASLAPTEPETCVYQSSKRVAAKRELAKQLRELRIMCYRFEELWKAWLPTKPNGLVSTPQKN